METKELPVNRILQNISDCNIRVEVIKITWKNEMPGKYWMKISRHEFPEEMPGLYETAEISLCIQLEGGTPKRTFELEQQTK